MTPRLNHPKPEQVNAPREGFNFQQTVRMVQSQPTIQGQSLNRPNRPNHLNYARAWCAHVHGANLYMLRMVQTPRKTAGQRLRKEIRQS